MKTMNKNNLLKFFRTNENIGLITGQYKQNVHKQTDFRRLDHVKALRKALIARFKDLTKDYNALIEQSDEVLRNAKTKAKSE